MSERLNVTVDPVDTPRAVVVEADVVITITKATEPLFEGDWLRPGTHVNAAGSNRATAREIDVRTVERADLIIIDDRSQGRFESGDLIASVEQGALAWDGVAELGEVVAGTHQGRRALGDVTLFESLGVAIEDVAVARRVYDKALRLGVGEDLPETILG
jgi:ornithine cyclodeaminase/alanine dehydrogenase-like protein (mu-crystallin family)